MIVGGHTVHGPLHGSMTSGSTQVAPVTDSALPAVVCFNDSAGSVFSGGSHLFDFIWVLALHSVRAHSCVAQGLEFCQHVYTRVASVTWRRRYFQGVVLFNDFSPFSLI